MYRKLIALLLALLMLLSFGACGKKDPARLSESFAGTPVTAVDESAALGTAAPAEEAENAENGEPPATDTAEEAAATAQSATEIIVSVTPGVTAGLGVLEGEDDSSLDDDSPTVSAPTATTSPTATTPPTVTDAPVTTPAPEEGSDVLPKDFSITAMTYESYSAMSGAQQQAVINLFASPEDFMKWYNAVKALYAAEHPGVNLGGDGVINAGDLIG